MYHPKDAEAHCKSECICPCIPYFGLLIVVRLSALSENAKLRTKNTLNCNGSNLHREIGAFSLRGYTPLAGPKISCIISQSFLDFCLNKLIKQYCLENIKQTSFVGWNPIEH